MNSRWRPRLELCLVILTVASVAGLVWQSRVAAGLRQKNEALTLKSQELLRLRRENADLKKGLSPKDAAEKVRQESLETRKLKAEIDALKAKVALLSKSQTNEQPRSMASVSAPAPQEVAEPPATPEAPQSLFSSALQQLSNADPQVRSQGIRTLTEQITTAMRSVEQLPPAQRAEALAHLGAEVGTAFPALLERLKDADPLVRSDAAWAFGTIQLQPETTVPALASILEDSDPRVRLIAASALGEYGADASAALAALVKAAQDPNPNVREAANASLRQIVPQNMPPMPGAAQELPNPVEGN